MIRVTGGTVYDPANGVNGVVRDLCIGDGKVVADVPAGCRTLDATGMVVFPGGVGCHTHIGGAALNFVRGLIPEQHRKAQHIFRRPHLLVANNKIILDLLENDEYERAKSSARCSSSTTPRRSRTTPCRRSASTGWKS